MKVGYFSPLPPVRTGVADYAHALLQGLRREGLVDVNARGADVNLYHIGNNQLHRAIYERAVAEPGVIVLHDAVLHHFFLGAFHRDEYIGEFVYNYGEWFRSRAEELWDGRGRSGSDAEYFRYPMLKRIAERSRAVIVHNAAAAEVVRQHAAKTRVFEIPHLFAGAPSIDDEDIRQARREMGAEPRDCIFGVFGHLRETKRVHAVVRAFEEASLPNAILLLAGESVSRELERALELYLANPRIVRRGYMDERTFWTYACAIDVCINLRYPSAGETSGIAVRMMGIGKAVAVTGGPEVASIPEAACLRIESGIREQPVITEVMRWLSSFPRDAEEIGARAKMHIASRHGIREVSRAYWEVLRSAA